MNEAVCVIMAKQPEVGRTKTRLSPPLAFHQAAALYEALLRDTISLVQEQPRIDLAVAISPHGSQPFFTRITPPGTCLLPVSGRDIGDCLSQVFSSLVEKGWRKVLALNADGPSLPPPYLVQAVQILDENDVVLGPALDGGYYLVGMKHFHPGIFEGVSWSSVRVLDQTLERAGALGLSVSLTPQWYDVDTFADMQRLQRDLDGVPPNRLVHTRKFLASFHQEAL